ncbi:MAG: FMN-binding negative transcriptional regulator [Pirellulales bacterium]|nr:FMN-binding negative transcriptional regulator [Pirellulales bacterium]
MYTPSSFKVSDTAQLHATMRSYSFATLVTQGARGLTATHLPILLDANVEPHGRLLGHMARANPQWRDITGEALVIFSGPHAYVSASWYETPGTVPTWNYVTVHAYGTLRLLEDPASVHGILQRTATTFEAANQQPWTYDDSDPEFNQMLREIVGFEIEISRIEGKSKLNQNHPEERRWKVVSALERQGDENSSAIAQLMRATLAGGV